MTATSLHEDANVRVSDLPSKVAGQEPPQSPRAKPRILVIDDDACFCELLCLYFTAKGFDVVAARTAPQAEPLLQEGGFDLMILDWQLNGVDSLDLLNRSKTSYPVIPVIVFTGDDVDLFLTKALASRADAVVRKMGSLESLSSQVCHFLGWPELRVVK